MKSAKPSCPAKPRVLISGFGLFQGAHGNISGSVVRNLGDWEVTPSILDAAEWFKLSPRSGVLRESEAPVRQTLRTLEISGREIEFCFLELSVQWTESAMALCLAALEFAPDLVVMTGQTRGAGVIEAGALAVAGGVA